MGQRVQFWSELRHCVHFHEGQAWQHFDIECCVTLLRHNTDFDIQVPDKVLPAFV